MKIRFPHLGPGVLITSAFIGPGTVTLCLLAGTTAGLDLLWAVVFSTVATVILQDMVVRMAFHTKTGLEECLKNKIQFPVLKIALIIYVFTAIILGNSAYESGNLAGTSLGVELMEIHLHRSLILWLIFITCALAFIRGSFNMLKKILGFLVFAMSLSFITMASILFPGLMPLIKGGFIPTITSETAMLAVGLIGTTIVPYNLFLHASAISGIEKPDLQSLRLDSAAAISVGGIISMAIVIIGNTAYGSQITAAADMAAILKMHIGTYGVYLFGVGLFAAGLSSALTAPMAAGFVAAGLFSWNKNLNHFKVKGVQLFVLTAGLLVSLSQANNISVIKIAQVINGILLPCFVIFLLWVLNDRSLMKVYKNNFFQNIAGVLVVIITLALAFKSIINILN
ncbi:MAG: Nramp family divalent metal transporter [Saprospiraceae bacterium]|nr:Nramp family divalent metal transporter [Saprospiraceae bacterium]